MAYRLIAKHLKQHQVQCRYLISQGSAYAKFSSVIKLEMPALSPTMSEGNILQWNKKEGDQVKVGDVLCEIQTDKATVGFESQEEGYLAKILVPQESKGVVIGALIGLLVEEKKDISTLDVSKYQAQQAPKVEQPKSEVSKEKKSDTQTKQHQTDHNEDFHTEYEKQALKMHIAPAASFYLKTYQILPSEVNISGPKNFIQKGDVLAFIKGQNLQKGQPRQQKQQQQAKAPEAKKEQKAKKEAAPQQNGQPDKNNLFKQSWQDKSLNDADKQVGSSIQQAKKAQAHSYISSYCAIDSLLHTLNEFDKKLTVDSVIIKAASKAFSKVFKVQNVDIARVSSQKVQIIKQSEKLTVSQINSEKSQILGSSNFAADVPQTLLEIHSVNSAIEVFPIQNPNTFMTLHYTEPQNEVVIDAPQEDLLQDIMTIGEKEVSYDLKLKTSKRIRLSISFDGSKVEEIQAVKFLHKVQTYLNDPDTMLL